MVIGILMAATMRFWSNRIVDLKAQSTKEQFVWYYNELYSQNMTSSFRDGKKYQTLVVGFSTWIYYIVDTVPSSLDAKLSDMQIKNLRFDQKDQSFPTATLLFAPYTLWCLIANNAGITWAVLYFDIVILQNGKQYCFEIKSETCKLVETKCT